MDHAFNAFKWLTRTAGAEWVQLCAVDLFRQMGLKGQIKSLRRMLDSDATVQGWLKEHGDAFNRAGEPQPPAARPGSEPVVEETPAEAAVQAGHPKTQPWDDPPHATTHTLQSIKVMLCR